MFYPQPSLSHQSSELCKFLMGQLRKTIKHILLVLLVSICGVGGTTSVAHADRIEDAQEALIQAQEALGKKQYKKASNMHEYAMWPLR